MTSIAPKFPAKFSKLARAEGWDVVHSNIRGHEVRRVIPSGSKQLRLRVLRADREAWDLVEFGTLPHQKAARDFIREHNRPLWNAMQLERFEVLTPAQQSTVEPAIVTTPPAAPAWNAAAEQAARSEGWGIVQTAQGLTVSRLAKTDGSILETDEAAMSIIYHGQQPWHHAARAHLRKVSRPLWNRIVLVALGY